MKKLLLKLGYFSKSAGKSLERFGDYLIKIGGREVVSLEPPEPKYEEENLSVNLSKLSEIFKRYGVEMIDHSSFTELRRLVRNDGKKYVINQIKEIIDRKDVSSINDIGRQLVEKFSNILREGNTQYSKFKEEIRAGKTDKNSPLIYPEMLDPYHKKLGLIINNRADFEDAICKVLDHIYNIGMKEVLGTFEVNIEFIEKYLKQNKEKSVEKEIKEISEKINNLLEEISAKTNA
jgi:hypothetical protein